MASYLQKLFISIFLLSVVNGKPTEYELISPLNSEAAIDMADGPLTNLETLENPDVYLIIAEVPDDNTSDNIASSSVEEMIKKRSAEEVDDLETAAGTNVLRPLFVYRQQLAFRERVKKGAVRRSGIRPRF